MLYKSDKKCCFNKYRNDIITKTWPEMDKTYMRVYIIEYAVHNSLKYNTLDDYSFFPQVPTILEPTGWTEPGESQKTNPQ